MTNIQRVGHAYEWKCDMGTKSTPGWFLYTALSFDTHHHSKYIPYSRMSKY